MNREEYSGLEVLSNTLARLLVRADGKPGTDGTFSAIFRAVARLAHVMVVDVLHRVTQRGNARQFLSRIDARWPVRGETQ